MGKRFDRLEHNESIRLHRYHIHRVACCDCGLVHEFELLGFHEGVARIRVRRAARSTAMMRRHGQVDLLNGTDPKWKMVEAKKLRGVG